MIYVIVAICWFIAGYGARVAYQKWKNRNHIKVSCELSELSVGYLTKLGSNELWEASPIKTHLVEKSPCTRTERNRIETHLDNAIYFIKTFETHPDMEDVWDDAIFEEVISQMELAFEIVQGLESSD